MLSFLGTACESGPAVGYDADTGSMPHGHIAEMSLHLRPTAKLVVNFLFIIIELLSLSFTAETF